MSRFARAVFLLTAVALWLLLPGSGEAALLEFLEMEDLTEISDLIVQARVVSVESAWNEARTGIRTRVMLDVERVLLGSLEGEKLSIELPGGPAPGGNLRQVIPGIPQFSVGEEAVIFLRNDPNLVCPVTGWIQGKFKVMTDPATGGKRVEDRLGKSRRYFERKGGISELKTVAGGQELTIEEFAAVIAEIHSRRGSGT